ncbi:MAG: class III signal peptide-containing protein [Candidatus Marsarchaeota archaeon]|nr:class III signal peptide-containing protein [Candidatus Marsarchaeota archaeon]
MKEKAQGSLEYILLIAGVLFILVIVVLVVKTNVLNPTSQNINTSSKVYQNVSNCNLTSSSNYNQISSCVTP